MPLGLSLLGGQFATVLVDVQPPNPRVGLRLVDPGDAARAILGDARSHPAEFALLHSGEGCLREGDDDVDLVG